MQQSNFKAIRQFKVPISWLRDFTRSYEKTSFRILRRGTVQHNTLRPRKMPPILQKMFSKCIFFYQNGCILISVLLKFVPTGPSTMNIIASHNVSAPKRRQAIIWTHASLVYWQINITNNANMYINYKRVIQIYCKMLCHKILSHFLLIPPLSSCSEIAAPNTPVNTYSLSLRTVNRWLHVTWSLLSCESPYLCYIK